MRKRIRPALAAAVATVSVVAVVGGLAAPRPPDAERPAQGLDVGLVAAQVPPVGALPLAFVRNQFQYCAVICPHTVQGAVEVPVALTQAPGLFAEALTTTGSVPRAVGVAAASVTGPANAAATAIIENDVYRVVPKAFNNLQVAVVELANLTAAVLRPGQFLSAFSTARANILAGLNQPLPPPTPTETRARTLPQVLAVEAIKVFTAVVFQAGELVLLGVVQSADAAARELAGSGDPVAALTAGGSRAVETIGVAGGVVRDAVDTAVTNIGDSLVESFPSSASRTMAQNRAHTHSGVGTQRDDPPVAGSVGSQRVAGDSDAHVAAGPDTANGDTDGVRRQIRSARTDTDEDAARTQSPARSSVASGSTASTSEGASSASLASFSEPSAARRSSDSASMDKPTPSARKNRIISGPPR